MVFDIISSVIDIALLYLYLNLFLSSPKKQLPKSLVFSCFLFVEIILYNANRLLISNQTMAETIAFDHHRMSDYRYSHVPLSILHISVIDYLSQSVFS